MQLYSRARLQTSLVRACWHLCMHGVKRTFGGAGVIFFWTGKTPALQGRNNGTNELTLWEQVPSPSQLSSSASQSCKSSSHNTFLIIIFMGNHKIKGANIALHRSFSWRFNSTQEASNTTCTYGLLDNHITQEALNTTHIKHFLGDITQEVFCLMVFFRCIFFTSSCSVDRADLLLSGWGFLWWLRSTVQYGPCLLQCWLSIVRVVRVV